MTFSVFSTIIVSYSFISEGKGWVSERFTKEKLADLFRDNGFADYEITRLCGIAYACRLGKPQ